MVSTYSDRCRCRSDLSMPTVLALSADCHDCVDVCYEMVADVGVRRYIVTFAEDRFTAMDVQRSGKINVVAVRSFVKSMSPGVNDAQVGLRCCGRTTVSL